MTLEKLHEYYWAQPFRPFTIQIAGGQRIDVPHRDFVALGKGGRTIIVYRQDESHYVIDLLLISHLEVAAPSPTQTEIGNR
jgi:hypothetical protein